MQVQRSSSGTNWSNSRTLASYAYNTGNGTLSTLIYGNGTSIAVCVGNLTIGAGDIKMGYVAVPQI